MNLRTLAVAALALSACAFPAAAETISTHVLDLARGVGGRDVPVTLQIKSTDGGWRDLATSRTDENGRVRSFGDAIKKGLLGRANRVLAPDRGASRRRAWPAGRRRPRSR